MDDVMFPVDRTKSMKMNYDDSLSGMTQMNEISSQPQIPTNQDLLMDATSCHSSDEYDNGEECNNMNPCDAEMQTASERNVDNDAELSPEKLPIEPCSNPDVATAKARISSSLEHEKAKEKDDQVFSAVPLWLCYDNDNISRQSKETLDRTTTSKEVGRRLKKPRSHRKKTPVNSTARAVPSLKTHHDHGKDSSNPNSKAFAPITMLIVLALKHSKIGCLSYSGICEFIRKEFPHYRTADDIWKSVHGRLSTGIMFVRVSSRGQRHMDLWKLNHIFKPKIDEELVKWQSRPPYGLVERSTDPERVRALIKGYIMHPSHKRVPPYGHSAYPGGHNQVSGTATKQRKPSASNTGYYGPNKTSTDFDLEYQPERKRKLEEGDDETGSNGDQDSCPTALPKKRKKRTYTKVKEIRNGNWMAKLYLQLAEDDEKFYNFTKMSIDNFNTLLNVLGNDMCPTDTIFPPRERLLLTLRYLAYGESPSVLQREFQIAISTIRRIIYDACDAICHNLKEEELPQLSEDMFRNSAIAFYKKYRYPHCMGAVGCKLFQLSSQCPKGSGNVNNTSVIILQVVVDADGNFISIDIVEPDECERGAGVLKQSAFGQALDRNELPIPGPDKTLEPEEDLNEPLPYIFVGDWQNPQKSYLMRAYPRKPVSEALQRNYNDRHFRAWRIVENVLDGMAAKWNVLGKMMTINSTNASKVILACCVLHNYLNNKEGCDYLEQPRPIDPDPMWHKKRTACLYMNKGRPSHEAAHIREKFTQLFAGRLHDSSLHFSCTHAIIEPSNNPSPSTPKSTVLQSNTLVISSPTDTHALNLAHLTSKDTASYSDDSSDMSGIPVNLQDTAEKESPSDTISTSMESTNSSNLISTESVNSSNPISTESINSSSLTSSESVDSSSLISMEVT